MIQSNYIPWRGYFDFIDDVDVFIFYDDVQYGFGKKWRNRNKIITPFGLKYLTVPLEKKRGYKLIDEVKINYQHDWQLDHINKLISNYKKAPYFFSYINQFKSILNCNFNTISELNIALCKWIISILNINTVVKLSRELLIQDEDKAIRPLLFLKKLNATVYLTGPNTAPYTDHELYKTHGIQLEFKSYDYLPYHQCWSNFCNNVSILDLIFNTGPNAIKYLKSRTPNVRVC